MVTVELKPGPNEQEGVDKQGAQVQAQSYSEKDPCIVKVWEQKEAGLDVIHPASVEAQEQEQTELGVIHPASVEGSVVIRGYQVSVRHVRSVAHLIGVF